MDCTLALILGVGVLLALATLIPWPAPRTKGAPMEPALLAALAQLSDRKAQRERYPRPNRRTFKRNSRRARANGRTETNRTH